jgi:hypothetical protein
MPALGRVLGVSWVVSWVVRGTGDERTRVAALAAKLNMALSLIGESAPFRYKP